MVGFEEKIVDLILWRHAEAEEGVPDKERRLTAKGEKQAAAMAAWLKPRLPAGCRVVASPARRTQQTARALTTDFETLPGLAVGESPMSLLAAVGWPDARGAVLVVGHQPTLGALASLLVCGKESDFAIRKGAVWWISRRNKPGDDKPFLRAVIGPDLL